MDDLSEEELRAYLINEGINPDDVIMFNEEEANLDDDFDDDEALSEEDLRAKLPPYHFMKKKQKWKFFLTLTNKYLNSIKQRRINK